MRTPSFIEVLVTAIPFCLLMLLQLSTKNVDKWAKEAFSRLCADDNVLATREDKIVALVVTVFNHVYFAIALISAVATAIASIATVASTSFTNPILVVSVIIITVIVISFLVLWMFVWRFQLQGTNIDKQINAKIDAASYFTILLLCLLAEIALHVPVHEPIVSNTVATHFNVTNTPTVSPHNR